MKIRSLFLYLLCISQIGCQLFAAEIEELSLKRKLTVTVGAYSMIGGRNDQQDRFLIEKDCLGGTLIAVFDGHGHGGDKVSQNLKNNFVSAFESYSENIDIPERFKNTFAYLDGQFKDCKMCGSTAIAAFVKDSKVTFANLGDSRGILATAAENNKKRVIFATKDHKANDKDEIERIRNAGGIVLYDRVGGALAVSRSFGDWHKNYFLNEKGDKLVISNPDVTTYDIDANSLVVLVCDGIVDNMCTDEEIVRVVREGTEESIYSDKELSNNQEEQDGDFKQAKILCHESFRRGLVPDNLTAIVMTFQIASKSSNNLNLTWKNLFFNKFFNSKMVSFGIPLFSIIALLYYVHNK